MSKKICKVIQTAYSWHGGGGSPFYSFASTRKIHGSDHRIRILNEALECSVAAVLHENPKEAKAEIRKLKELKAFVETAPLNVELVTDNEYNKFAG
jgi:hypothetical protein